MATAVLTRRSVFRAIGVAPSLRASAPSLMFASRRFAAMTSITPPENMALLNSQREKRPQSPHLTIYQPQITWILSSANRITGVFLSFALYGASLLYLLHPIFPAIDSASLIYFAQNMPGWLHGSLKTLFVLPFTFHTWNGIRHLAWDTGYGLTLKGVYMGGYTVLAATAVSSLYLAFFV